MTRRAAEAEADLSGGSARASSRERLLEATRELLWERGFSATSPADIRDRAGVGQGSMYHHFPTKADLAAAAMSRTADEVPRALDAHLDGAPTGAAAVARYLRKPRDGQRGCRFGRLTFDDGAMGEDRLRETVSDSLAWYRRRVEGLLARGQADGDLVDGFSPAEVAAAVVALVQGAHVLARADRSQASYEQAVAGGLAMLQALERRTGGAGHDDPVATSALGRGGC